MAKKKKTLAKNNLNGNDTKQLPEELNLKLIKDINTTVADFFGLPKNVQVGILVQAGCETEDCASIA